jgi:hypothetical protein
MQEPRKLIQELRNKGKNQETTKESNARTKETNSRTKKNQGN